METSIFNSNLKFVIELIQTLTEEKTDDHLQNGAGLPEIFEIAKIQPRESVCEDLDANKSLVDENQDL